MNNQAEFKEALGGLLLLAKASDQHLSRAQIEENLEDWDLSEEQWTLILSYLEMNQVVIEDHESSVEAISYLKGGKGAAAKEEAQQESRADAAQSAHRSMTEAEERCYAMYLEELKQVESVSPEEALLLAGKARAGSKEARNRLTEAHLKRVVELSGEYAGRGVTVGDLVQEGNMALLMAIDTFDGEDFGVHITREICSAMEASIAEQTGQDDTGSYLASQANAMMRATEELVEELGREATLEEVAARMNLSEDMTRDIMKISMDAMSVNEISGSGEVFGKQ